MRNEEDDGRCGGHERDIRKQKHESLSDSKCSSSVNPIMDSRQYTMRYSFIDICKCSLSVNPTM